MDHIPPSLLLIGAHTSIAGGLSNALLQGNEIGATTVQIFTSNQRQWESKQLPEEACETFKTSQRETGITIITSHAGYLINLGSPDPSALDRSRHAFYREIQRCKALGITFLVFHPGSALKESRDACLGRIVDSLLLMRDLLVDDSLRLLIETTAGQGSNIGSTFAEIATLIDCVKERIPIGVCIDTCHLFAAGYDISTRSGWEKTWMEFDNTIGREHLYAFHLNDSEGELNSHKDRHASLGEGKIGLECFRRIMREPSLQLLPKYLETPRHEIWDKEIGMLREFATG